ncbi:MAG: DUF4384 domain-containing protein [Burkholderiales bacterium]
MESLKPSFFARLGLTVALAGAFAGCSTLEVEKKTIEQTQVARQGPEQAPFRPITGFSTALRCMDNMMIDYGVRDVSMLVEDIVDQTKKVNAGTRDMLISALSDMTRRGRAIRVVAFGRDASNVISFLASAQRQSAYEAIPQFDIKGSVSQFDENVIRNQKDLGIGIQPFLNLGVSRDAASNILGLDLSVLNTDDMSVLPGVTSRNAVVILRTGRGADGDAAYHKFGVSYSMSLSKSEGQAQALRGLVELATIELVGKLTKTPYWRCLGAEADANDEIKLEMSDWYYAMSTSGLELIGYFQNQLRRRGFYEGPVDGKFNPAFDQAVMNYRGAIGMSREAVLDEALFKAYLNADHNKIARPARPVVFQSGPAVAAAAPSATPAPAATAAAAAPIRLALVTTNNQTRFARGEPIALQVQASRDAYVYCYLQDESAKIVRFFPNRFARDPMLPASRVLALPGAMPFQLAIKTGGARESIACFATPRDVLAQLPSTVVGADFEPLPVTSLEQVRAAFATAAGATLAQETLHVQAK